MVPIILHAISTQSPRRRPGEVRAPGEPGQAGPDLVIDVAELIWEPIAD
jgi:hypothetical protein